MSEQDEIQKEIDELAGYPSDRPSVEVVINNQKSLVPKTPQGKLATILAILVALATIAGALIKGFKK